MACIPSFECYYGKANINALRIFLDNGVLLWFSYSTPVAFSVNGSVPLVRKNTWGPTTGRHLNAIDSGDKIERVDGETFMAELQEALSGRLISRTRDLSLRAIPVNWDDLSADEQAEQDRMAGEAEQLDNIKRER